MADIDYALMAVKQRSDDELRQLRLSLKFLKSVKIEQSSTTGTIVCDVSTGAFRPYVPEDFPQKAFAVLHSLSYAGVRATQHLVDSRFVWPDMNTQVRH